MRIVVASCWKYRDAWKPFFTLLDKFWPNHPEVTLMTDWRYGELNGEALSGVIVSVVQDSDLASYGRRLATFASIYKDEPILLLQEDFFLNAPVQVDLVREAERLLHFHGAGCVRLYPCPGSDTECNNAHFGFVSYGSRYRISLQASIWRPSFLTEIASRCPKPAEFEIQGTIYAESLQEPVLAAKRDVQPWPLEYLCSAISRGKWNPDAKRLCDQYGIENDWSMRPFAA